MIFFRKLTNIVMSLLAIHTFLPTDLILAYEADDEVLIIRSDILAETAISRQIAISPRDPFNWPPEQIKKFSHIEKQLKEDPFTELKLIGIIWNKEKPLAIINNILVGQGETINKVFIREISPQQVILESLGRNQTLELSTDTINLGDIKE